MAFGRCAGCGYTDSPRRAAAHILDCEDYARLFANSPSDCLDPVAEHLRHQVNGAAHLKADARGARLRRRFAELDRRQRRHATRWATPPDILAD